MGHRVEPKSRISEKAITAIIPKRKAARSSCAAKLIDRVCSGAPVDGWVFGAPGTRGKWFLLVLVEDFSMAGFLYRPCGRAN
jgi:hypothetical protein